MVGPGIAARINNDLGPHHRRSRLGYRELTNDAAGVEGQFGAKLAGELVHTPVIWEADHPWASKSSGWKSGDPRMSSRPLMRSRVARRHFISLPTLS